MSVSKHISTNHSKRSIPLPVNLYNYRESERLIKGIGKFAVSHAGLCEN